MQNQSIADLWFDALAAELGASIGTLERYRAGVSDHLAWLGQSSLANVTSAAIRSYLEGLDRRHPAENTITLRRSIVSGIHKFILTEGHGALNPVCQYCSNEAAGTPNPMCLPWRMWTLCLQVRTREHPSRRPASTGRRGMRGARHSLRCFTQADFGSAEATTLPASAVKADTAALIVTGKGGRERMDSEPKTVTGSAVQRLSWARCRMSGRIGQGGGGACTTLASIDCYIDRAFWRVSIFCMFYRIASDIYSEFWPESQAKARKLADLRAPEMDARLCDGPPTPRRHWLISGGATSTAGVSSDTPNASSPSMTSPATITATAAQIRTCASPLPRRWATIISALR